MFCVVLLLLCVYEEGVCVMLHIGILTKTGGQYRQVFSFICAILTRNYLITSLSVWNLIHYY
jgi:hypothetical protein